jgi:Flp pilus assembly pilin Flp
VTRVSDLVCTLLTEDGGQDLVEYALLTALFGFAGIAAWVTVQNNIAEAYRGFDTGSQDLWEPCDPGDRAAGCGQTLP